MQCLKHKFFPPGRALQTQIRNSLHPSRPSSCHRLLHCIASSYLHSTRMVIYFHTPRRNAKASASLIISAISDNPSYPYSGRMAFVLYLRYQLLFTRKKFSLDLFCRRVVHSIQFHGLEPELPSLSKLPLGQAPYRHMHSSLSLSNSLINAVLSIHYCIRHFLHDDPLLIRQGPSGACADLDRRICCSLFLFVLLYHAFPFGLEFKILGTPIWFACPLLPPRVRQSTTWSDNTRLPLSLSLNSSITTVTTHHTSASGLLRSNWTNAIPDACAVEQLRIITFYPVGSPVLRFYVAVCGIHSFNIDNLIIHLYTFAQGYLIRRRLQWTQRGQLDTVHRHLLSLFDDAMQSRHPAVSRLLFTLKMRRFVFDALPMESPCRSSQGLLFPI